MRIDSKENYIAEGLVHKIYKLDEYIYKIPKDEFEDFNYLEHFAIEKNCHDILRRNSLPAVEVLNIYDKGELIKNKCVLKEFFIRGNVVDNKNATYKEREQIISLMLRVNKIKTIGYGAINSKGKTNFLNWCDYIKNSIEKSSSILRILDKKEINDWLDYLLKEIKIVPEINQGYFLTLDTNSNNYIFSDNQEIFAMLDIDHPISGDVLYEYSALKFHHPETFEILKNEYINLNQEELNLLNYYFIHFGVSTIAFEFIHNLDLTNSLRSLRNV